jgi:8-oxo-dGTP pyrophosphatase MutT (NUDIX family)
MIWKTRKNGRLGGVGIVICNKYYDKSGLVTPTLLAVLEGSGHTYAGKLNVCGGRVENQDKSCYLLAAMREFHEETGWEKLDWSKFDAIFKDPDTHQYRIVFHSGTPIFIGVYNGLSRGPLNAEITRRHKPGSGATSAMRETLCVDWINMNTCKRLDNTVCRAELSDYLQAVVPEVKAYLKW